MILHVHPSPTIQGTLHPSTRCGHNLHPNVAVAPASLGFHDSGTGGVDFCNKCMTHVEHIPAAILFGAVKKKQANKQRNKETTTHIFATASPRLHKPLKASKLAAPGTLAVVVVVGSNDPPSTATLTKHIHVSTHSAGNLNHFLHQQLVKHVPTVDGSGIPNKQGKNGAKTHRK